jgi:hypothetical protein
MGSRSSYVKKEIVYLTYLELFLTNLLNYSDVF